MKIERVRKGTEMMNKLDGKHYRITAVFCDEAGKVMEATAAEMIENEGEEVELSTEHIVQITEANALAFRITKDAKPETVVTGFSVIDGNLYQDGRPIEQGQLKVLSVLSSHIGAVLLAVESGDDVALMTYEPDRDYFRKVLVELSEVPEVLKVSGESCLMAIEHTKEIEAEGKDGQKEKKTVFAGTTLILYQNGNHSATVHETNAKYGLTEALYTESPFGLDVWFPCDAVAGEDADPVAYKVRRWVRFALYDAITCKGFAEMNGALHVAWSHAYNCYVLHNNDRLCADGIGLDIESPLVEKIGDKILIDVNKKEGVYRLTFSDTDYQFVTLVSRKTSDRGLIVTIE